MKKNAILKFMHKKRNFITSGIIPYVILTIIPLILYFHTVNFGFTGLDDEDMIVNASDFMQKFENIPQAFMRDVYGDEKGDMFYRPFGTISYMLDSQISGANPRMHHLTNLILHILSITLLYYFLLQIGLPKNISLWVLLIYTIHPLFTHAVCWIPSRMDLLLAVFSLLSMIMLIHFLRTIEKKFVILHALFFFVAVFSKETALILPLIYLLFVYKVKGTIAVKKNLVFACIWIFIITVYILMRSHIIQSGHTLAYLKITTLIENLPVIPIILSKFIIPFNLSPLPQFELFFTITGTLLIGLIIFEIYRSKNNSQKIKLLGFIWYITFSLPPLAFKQPLSILGVDYLEHRAYLPLLGMTIFLVQFLSELKLNLNSRPAIFAYGIIILGFSSVSYSNSYNYESPSEFVSSAIRLNPKCVFAIDARARLKYRKGDLRGAEEDYNLSVSIDPDNQIAWYNKGVLYTERSSFDSAIVCYNRAIQLDSLYFEAFVNRANAKYKTSDFNGAIADYQKSIAIDSSDYNLYFDLANLLAGKNMYQQAIQNYSRAILLNPGDFESFTNRANIRCTTNDFKGAIEDCDKALTRNNKYPQALYVKAKSYFYMGQCKAAIQNIDETIAIDPQFPDVYNLKKQILNKLNNTK